MARLASPRWIGPGDVNEPELISIENADSDKITLVSIVLRRNVLGHAQRRTSWTCAPISIVGITTSGEAKARSVER